MTNKNKYKKDLLPLFHHRGLPCADDYWGGVYPVKQLPPFKLPPSQTSKQTTI